MSGKRRNHRLTYRVDLPGGQQRLREMILYVSERCENAPRFGKVKLNKILWKADFDSFAERGIPVTGRSYQRLQQGPAPVEMPPVLAEMIADGVLDFQTQEIGPGFVEERPIARRPPNTREYFTQEDLQFVDAAIAYFWSMTAGAASDASHGLAWKSRDNLDAMPYEAAYLVDEEAPEDLLQEMRKYAELAGLRSH
jgi:hypothetical protein